MSARVPLVNVTTRRSLQGKISEKFKKIKRDCNADPDSAKIICSEEIQNLKIFCTQELESDRIHDFPEKLLLEIIKTAYYDGEKDKFQAEIENFETMSHNVLFDVVQSRFKKQSIDYKKYFHTMEFRLNSFKIPNLQSNNSFDGIYCKFESRKESFLLEFDGTCSILFFLCHIEKIIEQFLSSLPHELSHYLRETPVKETEEDKEDDKEDSFSGSGESEDETNQNCIDCSLISLCHNIDELLEEDFVPSVKFCDGQCRTTGHIIVLLAKHLIHFFAASINFENDQVFASNWEKIVEHLLKEDAVPLFLMILHSLHEGPTEEINSSILQLAYLICPEIIRMPNFVLEICEDKLARKKLISVLREARSMYELLTGIKILYKMSEKMHLNQILPSRLTYLEQDFDNAPIEPKQLHNHLLKSAISVTSTKLNCKMKAFRIENKKYGNQEIDLVNEEWIFIERFNSSISHYIDLEDSFFNEQHDVKNVRIQDSCLHCGQWTMRIDNIGILLQCIETCLDENDDLVQNQETKTDNSFKSGKIIKTLILSKEDVQSFRNSELHPKLQKYYFNTTECGNRLPPMYLSPCVLSMKVNRINKQTREKGASYNRLYGFCKLCESNSKHTFEVLKNPYNTVGEAVSECKVKVTVEGSFYLDENGDLDISRPVHISGKTASRNLRGIERFLMAKKASDQGIKASYQDQLWNENKHQLEHGNLTSLRSEPVISMARGQLEEKSRLGSTFMDSVLNTKESQSSDYSSLFTDKTSWKFPGMIRMVQIDPVNIKIATYEQLRIGFAYLTKTKNSYVFIGKCIK